MLSAAFVRLLAYLAIETALGSGVVCAEAETLHGEEQAAVAVVAASRARRANTSPVVELLRPRQFAVPCSVGRTQREHVAAWLRGRWLGEPHWSRPAVSFCSRGAALVVGDRWRRRGLVPLMGVGTGVRRDGRRGHVYWARR